VDIWEVRIPEILGRGYLFVSLDLSTGYMSGFVLLCFLPLEYISYITSLSCIEFISLLHFSDRSPRQHDLEACDKITQQVGRVVKENKGEN